MRNKITELQGATLLVSLVLSIAVLLGGLLWDRFIR